MSEFAGLGSYRCFVAGGAGDVGEGIAGVLLQAGAHVGVNSRSQEKLKALKEGIAGSERLSLVEAAWDLTGSTTIARHLEEHGELDIAVASLGPWWHAPLLIDQDLATWERVVEAGLTAHFMAAKTLIPRLRSGGDYILINGGAALAPVPTAGPVSVVAAAQLMLKDVLAAEHPGIRVRTLLLNTPIITRSRPAGEPGWLSAADVGKACVGLALGDGQSGDTVQLDSSSEARSLWSGVAGT